MNYFELFGMQPSLKVDRVALKKKFLELSRQTHPDYFIQDNAATQQAALENAAVLNKAYKTLSNEQDTIRYLLAMKGMMEENEKYALPPQFLLEMLELNEAMAEAEDADAKQTLLQKVKETGEEIYAPVAAIVENYQEGNTSEKELLQVKEYYFKKKYLERLQQQML